MFNSVIANPCRFIEAIFDTRQLRRTWYAMRRRGVNAIITELSSDNEHVQSLLYFPALPKNKQTEKALLIIDARIPEYDHDAGARSCFLYLQLLRSEGHRVYFMPNDQLRREPYARQLEELGVQLLIGRDFYCSRWKKWLAVNSAHISHVILHRPNVANRYLASIKKTCDAKIIYFAHDLRFIREKRHFEVTGEEFHRREAEYWEEIEKGILAQVDFAYFFSNREVEIVTGWQPRCETGVIPLFPMVKKSSLGNTFEQRSGIMFVGGFSHQPNLDAVLWFAKEVFPIIKSEIPVIEWHIVGREPPAEICKLAGGGINVKGGVSENLLDNLYQSSKVVIAPLRFGAGVKGKVVEAISHGIPIVTTSIGAEGITEADVALCVADSAQDMARHIIALCKDAVLWQQTRALIAAESEQDGYRKLLEILAQDSTTIDG